MRPFALALLLVTLGSAAPVRADVIVVSYSTDFSTGSSFPYPDGFVPQFDSARLGGELLSVQVLYALNGYAPILGAENRTPDFLDARITFTDQIRLSAYVLDKSSPAGFGTEVANTTVAAREYTPTLDPFGSDQGSTFAQLTGTYSAANLSPFIGTEGLAFLGTHDFEIDTVTPGSGVAPYISPDWISTGSVTVTYTYSTATPAPPGVLLGLIALPGLVLFRRRTSGVR